MSKPGAESISGGGGLVAADHPQLTIATYSQEVHHDLQRSTDSAKNLMQQSSQLRFMLTSIVASSMANVAGLLAGHPLDTIRVRMQTSSRKITARQCAYESIKKEGTFSLYKGVSQPLIGAVPATTLLFYTSDACKSYIGQKAPNMSSSRQSLIAGGISGFTSLSIFVPLELLKCRAQVQKKGQIKYGQMISELISVQGMSGLYRGFWAMAWRDTPAWAVYFACYEKLKEVGDGMALGQNCSKEQASLREFLWLINAGGMAGMLSWASSIPQDVIKTRQQTHLGDRPLTIMETYYQLKNEGGTRNMFKGMYPTLLRGYVVNMVTLPLFDCIKSQLEQQGRE